MSAWVKLVLPKDQNNFTLSPDKVKYHIDKGGPQPDPDPTDPDDDITDVVQPELDPDKEYEISKIKFIGDASAPNPIYQGDPDQDPTGYTIPFKHDDEVVIVAEVTFVTVDVTPQETETRILIPASIYAGTVNSLNLLAE